MITNVHRAKAASDIQRYIRYTIAPKKNKTNEHYQPGERLLSVESDNFLLGSNIQYNKTSHKVTDEFIKWNTEKRNNRPQPKSPAVLGVISFSEADTEKFYSTKEDGTKYLDHQKIIDIAREAVAVTMGGNRLMYFALHGDTKTLHVHFAATMVDSQGKIYDGSKMVNEDGKKVSVRDFRQWEITNEGLEQKYGLDRVEHRKAFEHEGEHRQTQVARLSNQVKHLLEKGEIAPSLDLATELDFAYTNCNKQFDKFLELTQERGIRIKPNMNETKINGFAFAIGDMDGYIKASDLGNRYKWAKLSKDLNYDNTRDFTACANLKASAERIISTPGTDINRDSSSSFITPGKELGNEPGEHQHSHIKNIGIDAGKDTCNAADTYRTNQPTDRTSGDVGKTEQSHDGTKYTPERNKGQEHKDGRIINPSTDGIQSTQQRVGRTDESSSGNKTDSQDTSTSHQDTGTNRTTGIYINSDGSSVRGSNIARRTLHNVEDATIVDSGCCTADSERINRLSIRSQEHIKRVEETVSTALGMLNYGLAQQTNTHEIDFITKAPTRPSMPSKAIYLNDLADRDKFNTLLDSYDLEQPEKRTRSGLIQQLHQSNTGPWEDLRLYSLHASIDLMSFTENVQFTSLTTAINFNRLHAKHDASDSLEQTPVRQTHRKAVSHGLER